MSPLVNQGRFERFTLELRVQRDHEPTPDRVWITNPIVRRVIGVDASHDTHRVAWRRLPAQPSEQALVLAASELHEGALVDFGTTEGARRLRNGRAGSNWKL